MSSDWTEQVFQHMRKSPCTVMDLSVIGAAVRRPVGCAKNSKLVDWLERDSRFRVQRSGENMLVVNIGLQQLEEPAVDVSKAGKPAPTTIAAVAEQFAAFLEELPTKERPLCSKNAFRKSKYDSWKADHKVGHTWKAVKYECVRRGKFVYSSNSCSKSEKHMPSTVQGGGTMESDNASSKGVWVSVSEFCFDKNPDGTQRTVAKGQHVTAVGVLKCAAAGAAGVSLTKIRAVHKQHKFTFSLRDEADPSAPATMLALPLQLSPRQRVGITARFAAQQSCAVVNTELLFFFLNNGAAFVIKRAVKIHIGDSATAALLAPIAPYQRPQQPMRQQDETAEVVIVDGVRPAGAEKADTFYIGPGLFSVPAAWRLKCKVGLAAPHLTQQRQALSDANIKDLFHHLVWTEELQMDIDIKSYSIDNKALTARGGFLCLEVPGLAEKRPSVLKGDAVIVHRPGQSNTLTKYKGYVHAVERDLVCLKFDPAFHRSYTAHTAVNVEFTFTRMPLRICHEGIDALTPALVAYLLPPPLTTTKPSSAITSLAQIRLTPVDTRLNAQQLLAVERIVQHSNRAYDCPYILYGPPGTGKTSTVVEAIKQVGIHRPATKILICAPSNTAADVLLQRLSTSLSRQELFRFNSYQRDLEPGAVAYKFGCFDATAGAFAFPPLEHFLTYRYVVCTCAMAGRLFNYGIPRGYFTTVFVDEAGHGWEPEVLSAFSSLLNIGPSSTCGQLILAGDPQQLGPIVRSDAVNDTHGGLSISLLERLITTHPAYKRDMLAHPFSAGYDPHVLTMLLNCYRCHPDILKLPNDLFYCSLLKASAAESVTHNLCNWSGLPTAGFPLIFHGVEGENVREANSPSWFNVAEVEKVCQYVHMLVDIHKVPAADVAVIAPYHKQVVKITQLLRARGGASGKYAGVAVGSCEKMQGQERRVVILSTVRSSAAFQDADQYFNLGFVANPKRFNVAVTRAKALLIVVGNPNVLARDPHWGGLLRWCVSNGGYKGCALTTAAKEGVEGSDTSGSDGSDDDGSEADQVADVTRLLGML